MRLSQSDDHLELLRRNLLLPNVRSLLVYNTEPESTVLSTFHIGADHLFLAATSE